METIGISKQYDNPFGSESSAIGYGSCLVCGARQRTGKFYDINTYRVVECVCGHWYLENSLPEQEMLKMYASDKYFNGGEESSIGYVSYASQESALRLSFRRMVDILDEEKVLGGRLLEVGCGYGYFLKEARDKFSYVAGADFSCEAIKNAARHADAVYHGGLEKVVIEQPGSFDMVVAIEVLEHVYDPLKFLLLAKAALRMGGYVVISVPNAGSLYRKIMGRRWPSWKVPEHVSHFTMKSLLRLMRRAGYIYMRDLPIPHAYPLGLLFSKAGISLPLPRRLAEHPVWVRGNILTVIGMKP